MLSSNQENLARLGINIWKKRTANKARSLDEEMYLIDEEFIIVLGEKSRNESEDNKKIFLRSLLKSIGRKNYYKDFKFDNINSLKKIFLLDAQLPQILKEIEESKILRNKSISEICHSKETKLHFLELFSTT
tara:strand:- start:1186 stop:1581 length:396 start_codon:yes stop_codon:yes gene_type:complete